MNVQHFIKELKRRNVFKVATAYAIAGWLIIQVVTVIEEPLALPDWFDTAIIILVAIGFPIALIIAWAFELTPEGMKKSDEVDITESVTHQTGKKLNVIIISVLSLLVLVLLIERFAFVPNGIEEIDRPQISKVSQQSVAVLPFADMSENKDQDWFSDGLTEEILNSLAQLPELKVTSRTSAFQFKGKDIDISIIADTLGVAHIVEGSVRRIGDQLRITAQLIRAEDGFHLWSETYDSSTENLFEVQSDIAEEIARTLDVFLNDERREQMFAVGTRNVKAFQEFLKGMGEYNKFHEAAAGSIWKANEHFDNALELDPTFGRASIMKMDAYVHFLRDGLKSKVDLSEEEARDQLIQSLEYGIQFIDDQQVKLSVEILIVFFSDSWYQLPDLISRLKDELGANQILPNECVWCVEILSLFGEKEIIKEDARINLEKDPLSLNDWYYKAMVDFAYSGAENGVAVLNESKHKIGNHPLIPLFEDYWFALENNYVELDKRYPEGFDPGNQQILMSVLGMRSFTAAKMGETEVANDLIKKVKENDALSEDIIVKTLYELGYDEEADAIIKKIDSRPIGSAKLALEILSHGNRLYFDLNNAPNTAARFKEAGIDTSIFKKMSWVN